MATANVSAHFKGIKIHRHQASRLALTMTLKEDSLEDLGPLASGSTRRLSGALKPLFKSPLIVNTQVDITSRDFLVCIYVYKATEQAQRPVRPS